MQLAEIISRLENVHKGNNGYTARCPAHEDKKNSLGISQGEDGHILLRCYTGCEFGAIVKALNLTPADLMPDKKPASPNNETVYKIKCSNGDEIEHVRIDEPGGKKFIWRRNGESGLGGLKIRDLPLYRPQAQGKSEAVFICEGEKAAIAAARLGCEAYGTVSGASSCPGREALAFCKGKAVVLWADNDDPGRKHMSMICTMLEGIAKSVATITTGGNKDDAADFKGTFADLQKIIDSSSGAMKSILLSDKVDEALASLRQFSDNDMSDRIPTGLTRLDEALRGGLMKAALYLVGAPSGHGKTTLLQNFAVHCAIQRGPVLFVSPEMSGVELAEREALRMAGISINQIAPWKHANDRVPGMVRISEAMALIKNERLPIHIIDDTDITMPVIEKVAARIKNLKLVIVDYAQEIAGRETTASRYLAVGEVGKDALSMGKRLSIPVIVASQVNVFREGNTLDYTFRETKDLENRAHCSMILEIKREKTPNRYGYYDIESARIFARKNRSGAVFSVDVDYNPALFSVKNKTIETYNRTDNRNDF